MSSNETAGVSGTTETGFLDVTNIKYDPATDWRESRGRLPIIGIGGPFGSGKDECAKAVTGMFDNAVIVRFADGVRDGLMRMNPFVHANANGKAFRLLEIINAIGWEHAKRTYPEIRRLMQAYGDDAGRQIHGDDCWVNRLKARIYELEHIGDDKRPQCYVVPDVRYPGEVDFINKFGLGCMFVDRPGIDATEAARQHSSESHFAYVREQSRRIVVNDGPLSVLHDRACREASRIMLNLFVDDDGDKYSSFAKNNRELDKLRFIAGDPASKILATDGRIAACVIADENDRQWCLTYGAQRCSDGMVQFVREHFPDNESSDESKYEHARCVSAMLDTSFGTLKPIPSTVAYCDHDDVAVNLQGTSVTLAKRFHDVMLRMPGCRFLADASIGDDMPLKFRFGTASSGPLQGRGLVMGLNVPPAK